MKADSIEKEKAELMSMLRLARQRQCRGHSEDKNPLMSLSCCQLKEEDWAEWDRLYRLPAFKGARLEEKLQAAMKAPKKAIAW